MDIFLEREQMKFKEYKARVKNHTERKIKTLRLDNGIDFTSEESKELSRDSRFKRELSTPYTSGK